MRLFFLLSFLSLLTTSCRTQYKQPHRVESERKKDTLPAGKPVGKMEKEEQVFTRLPGDDEEPAAPPSEVSYLPRCTPAGLKSGGTYSLAYHKTETASEMVLEKGEGFSCKAEVDTDHDDTLPRCRDICPDSVDSLVKGWGWCSGVKGFACREEQANP